MVSPDPRAHRVPPPAPGRIVGLDVARWWALMGMVATHALVSVRADGHVTLPQQLAGGRSAALFAVLAGVTMALMSGRVPVEASARVRTGRGLLARAALLLMVGMVLAQLGTTIVVILAYYAALFVLGIPFLGLTGRRLLAVAALWAVAAPLVSFVLRPHLPEPLAPSPALEDLGSPVLLAGQLVFTGWYPAFVWLAYLLIGIAVGRAALDRTRTAVVLLAGGLLVAATSYAVSRAVTSRAGVRATLAETLPPHLDRGGLDLTLERGLQGSPPTENPWWLAVVAPHSGTTFDLLHTGGCAVAVIGACLLVAPLAPRVLAVVFGGGAMTLTLYSLHVALRSPGWLDADSVATFTAHVVLLSVVGAAARWSGHRGPLEWLASRAHRWAAGPRPHVSARRSDPGP